MSFFRKDKKIDKSIKKVDALISWLVLSWIIASVYWIKKHEDQKKDFENIVEKDKKMSLKTILKWLIFGFKIEKKEIPVKKKPIFIKIINFIFNLFSRLWKK